MKGMIWGGRDGKDWREKCAYRNLGRIQRTHDLRKSACEMYRVVYSRISSDSRN